MKIELLGACTLGFGYNSKCEMAVFDSYVRFYPPRYSTLTIPVDTRWLVVFDNVEEVDEHNIWYDYCPSNLHWHVSVTTCSIDLVLPKTGRR